MAERRPRRGPGRDVFDWWSARLAEFLPARLQAGASLPDAMVVTMVAGAEGAAVAVRKRGRESPLGSFRLDAAALSGLPAAVRRRPRRVVLRPPPGTAMERQVVLPLAAQHDPGGVLRYELDRLTPFSPDEVAWSWRIAGKDPVRNLLRLDLSLVPRTAVRAAVEALSQAGLPPDTVEAAVGGAVRSIPLGEPSAASVRRTAWQRRGLAAATAVCACLAATAVVLPFVLQSLALASAERQIEALQPRVAEADALRRRMAAAKGGQDAFATERARVGDALRTVAALTELLPDDTWLTELSLRQRKLLLSGRSAGASRIIGLLSGDPAFRDAAFAAPVTRADQGGVDVFSIRAEAGM